MRGTVAPRSVAGAGFIEGIAELQDDPNEFVVDSATRTLSYIPNGTLGPETEFIVPVRPNDSDDPPNFIPMIAR